MQNVELKVKALVHAFENHSSQYHRAGQFFWRGSEMGNGAKAGLPWKSESRSKQPVPSVQIVESGAK